MFQNRCEAVTPSGKPFLHGESYEELKRQLRERKNLLKCIPRILLKENGERASLDTEEAERVPLFVSDIQDLLVYTQTEHTFYKPRWYGTGIRTRRDEFGKWKIIEPSPPPPLPLTFSGALSRNRTELPNPSCWLLKEFQRRIFSKGSRRCPRFRTISIRSRF